MLSAYSWQRMCNCGEMFCKCRRCTLHTLLFIWALSRDESFSSLNITQLKPSPLHHHCWSTGADVRGRGSPLNQLIVAMLQPRYALQSIASSVYMPYSQHLHLFTCIDYLFYNFLSYRLKEKHLVCIKLRNAAVQGCIL